MPLERSYAFLAHTTQIIIFIVLVN
jgi:hypothetical protein